MNQQENQQKNKEQGSDKRGFASMDAEKQKDLASQGNRSSQEQGAGREFKSDEAGEGSRKGGNNTSQDKELKANTGSHGAESAESDDEEQETRLASQTGNESQKDSRKSGSGNQSEKAAS